MPPFFYRRFFSIIKRCMEGNFISDNNISKKNFWDYERWFFIGVNILFILTAITIYIASFIVESDAKWGYFSRNIISVNKGLRWLRDAYFLPQFFFTGLIIIPILFWITLGTKKIVIICMIIFAGLIFIRPVQNKFGSEIFGSYFEKSIEYKTERYANISRVEQLDIEYNNIKLSKEINKNVKVLIRRPRHRSYYEQISGISRGIYIDRVFLPNEELIFNYNKLYICSSGLENIQGNICVDSKNRIWNIVLLSNK